MTDKKVEESNTVKRPFFYGILCFAVLIYSGFISLLFIFGILFSVWITDVTNNYLPEWSIDKKYVFWLAVAGTVLFLCTFIGALLLWKMRRFGYFLFIAATIIIIIIPFTIGLYNYLTIIIFSVIILLFTLHYRKLK